MPYFILYFHRIFVLDCKHLSHFSVSLSALLFFFFTLASCETYFIFHKLYYRVNNSVNIDVINLKFESNIILLRIYKLELIDPQIGNKENYHMMIGGPYLSNSCKEHHQLHTIPNSQLHILAWTGSTTMLSVYLDNNVL